MAPPITCECGSCAKCERRTYMRDYYRRNPDRCRTNAAAARHRRVDAYRAYDRERGYRPGDPVKVRARRQVAQAIEDGTLIRHPCEVCGDPRTDGHHDDYSRPLAVRWLCRQHHGEQHRVIR